MSNDLAILNSHLSTLIEARTVSPNDLGPLVSYALEETKDTRSPDTRRAQWELLLKGEVFRLAATEGDALKHPKTTYYEDLRSGLDMVLAFTEHDACDASFPFSVLGDLLETQTVSSCLHIFSWMEERREKLTADMSSTKSKPLILLRMLNDLLRRLSKTGKNTMFCGRILNFLSGVFPLGERSGVNLRGDYGALWDGPGSRAHLNGGEKKRATDDDVDMQNGHKRASSEEAKKEEFYQTFWSLQIPFSRPPLFARALSFDAFRKGVDTVLPVISEATKKERAMMGSKAVGGGLKRKRDEPDGNGNANVIGTNPGGWGGDYFAKFLTSPELLDLEIADTNFRRQFLFQLLILLQHLLQFTAAEKPRLASTKNRSLQMDITLDTADEKWCQDSWTRVMEEMRATTPNGKNVAETIAIILERENNWIRWKNDLCPPFDKEPLQPSLEEQTKEKREKILEPQPDWRYSWGTEAITELWETGFHGLQDCENTAGPGEPKDFAKRIKQVEMRIEMRKKQLARPRPPPAQPSSQPLTTDAQGPAQEPVPVPIPPAASVPTVPTPAPLPTAPSSLHPSLPPRPITSPSPRSNIRPQTAAQLPTGQTQVGPSQNALQATQPQPPVGDHTKPSTPLVPEAPADPQLTELGEQKDRLAWLALRRTRTDCLHMFAKFGVTGVDGLVETIELEKKEEAEREKEKEKEKEKTNGKEGAQQDQMDIEKETAEGPSREAETITQASGDASKVDSEANAVDALVVSSTAAKMDVDDTV